MSLFRKSTLAVACALAAAAAQAADVTIGGPGGVQATINDHGTFASSSDAGGGPPQSMPGLSYQQVETVNIDTPFSYWWLQTTVGTTVTDYKSYYDGIHPMAGPLGVLTTNPGGALAFTANLGAGIGLSMTWNVASSNKLATTVSITNNTGVTFDNVKWGVGFDPDQGRPNFAGTLLPGGTNATANKILGQDHAAAVEAWAPDVYGVSLVNTTSASAHSVKAYIDTTCCSAVNPSFMIAAAQPVGFNNYADYSINLAYDLGPMAHFNAGGVTNSETIGYDYIFQPIPEPETYAMMLAGLGLMGFMVRRRRQRAIA